MGSSGARIISLLFPFPRLVEYELSYLESGPDYKFAVLLMWKQMLQAPVSECRRDKGESTPETLEIVCWVLVVACQNFEDADAKTSGS
jgi:hypothetical protein